MSELTQFIRDIPPITRALVLSTLTLAGLDSLGIVNAISFVFYWQNIYEKWEFYRLITGFLVMSPERMQGLFETYLMYTYSRDIESGKFQFNLPDYIYYHLIVVSLIWFFSIFSDGVFLSLPLLSALTYTWSINNYNSQVSFYFMSIKASLLPAVFLGFRLLLEGRYFALQCAVGMFAAYIYNCIETKTFGPLIGLFSKHDKDVSNATANIRRVGTLKNTQASTWIYGDYGYLQAPNWLTNLCIRLTGINYKSSLYQNQRRKNQATAIRNATMRPGTTAGSSSSFIKSTITEAFRGRGQRLGNGS
ncbi:ER-associated protein degradation protein [Komagataella phaffii]|nr:GQ68_02663T0 [Komagataella phaffii GS115]